MRAPPRSTSCVKVEYEIVRGAQVLHDENVGCVLPLAVELLAVRVRPPLRPPAEGSPRSRGGSRELLRRADKSVARVRVLQDDAKSPKRLGSTPWRAILAHGQGYALAKGHWVRAIVMVRIRVVIVMVRVIGGQVGVRVGPS